MTDEKTKAKRERAAALRRKAKNRERLRQLGVYGAFALVIVGLIAGAAVAINNAGSDATPPTSVDLTTASGQGASTTPPWSLPADVPARVKAAGLNLGAMGTAEHYHAHLDILIDGKPVGVPANIGIDPNNGAMSAVHTHTDDGVIHVEAATKGQTFTLGQLFTQWNVRLSATQIGSFADGNGNSFQAYINGKEISTDPAMIRLSERQQIALVYGPEGAKVTVPDSFKFGEGL